MEGNRESWERKKNSWQAYESGETFEISTISGKAEFKFL